MSLYKDIQYPIYRISDRCFYAFIRKDYMFKIEPRGTNSNPGIAVDEYVTRNMVLHHLGKGGKDVTRSQFEAVLQKLFSQTVNKILS